jgi:hypothetical protein
MSYLTFCYIFVTIQSSIERISSNVWWIFACYWIWCLQLDLENAKKLILHSWIEIPWTHHRITTCTYKSPKVLTSDILPRSPKPTDISAIFLVSSYRHRHVPQYDTLLTQTLSVIWNRKGLRGGRLLLWLYKTLLNSWRHLLRRNKQAN